MTCKAVEESKPVVGSSKNTRLGLVSNSTPIDARFLSPPDTPLVILFPILVLEHLTSPSSTISYSTRVLFSAGGKLNLKFAENIKASIEYIKQLLYL